MTEDYVVVCTTEYDDVDPRAGRVTCRSTMEIYRGSKKECRRIATNFGGQAYDDNRRTKGATIEVGTAKGWDEFLEDMAADAENGT